MSTIVASAGGGDWNTGASWVGGSAPTAGDDAQVPLAAGNMVIGAGAVCRGADFSTYTGQLSGTGTLTIGDATAGLSSIALKLVSGMTISGTPNFSFVTTSATVQTIDFAGKTTGDVTFNATSNGSWQYTGAHTIGISGTLTLTKGTLDINGQTCSWGIFNSNNSNVRALTLGAAAITISGASATVWALNTATSMTLTANTSTITFTGTGATMSSSATGGALTYNTVTFSAGGQMTLSGTSVFANLTVTGAASKTDFFLLGGNNTISTSFTINGQSTVNRIILRSTVNGTARTVTAASITASNVDFRDITGAGAGSWNLSAITGGSGDCGGNTSITFTTASDQTYTGGTSNWSDVAKWTSRIPLPQDNCLMSGVTGGTITADMPRIGKNIDWTGASGTPAWSFASTTNDIFGSITLISAMTVSGTQALTLRGRSSFTLTSVGQQFTQGITIDAPGGTYTLLDAFSTASTMTITNGSFVSSGFNLTCTAFASTNSNIRTLTLTGSLITLTLGSGNIWNTATVTGLTFNASGSEIVLSSPNSSTKTFQSGGLTFGTLTYIVSGSTGIFDLTGASTIGTLNFSDASNARTLRLQVSTTTTILNTWNVNGSVGKLISVISSSGGTPATLSKASGIVSSDYLSIQDITATGGATWYAGANSTNVSGNTGWIFTAAPSTNNDFQHPDTLTTQQKILLLAKSTGDPQLRLHDQFVAKLGTYRKSKIIGNIGNTGVVYEKLVNDYLKGL